MSMFPAFHGSVVNPGIKSTLESPENQFWFGHWTNQKWLNAEIDSTARDAGNTDNTKILRAGCLLGKITATGRLIQWDPTATDGTQFIYGVLGLTTTVEAAGGTVANRFLGKVMYGGNVKAAGLIVASVTAPGISGTALESLVITQMSQRGRFLIDTDTGHGYPEDEQVLHSTDATLALADSGKTHVLSSGTTGGTFTLPAALPGMHFRFFNELGKNMNIVRGSTDTITALGFPNTATTIAYTDGTNPADGASCEISCRLAGQWQFRSTSNNVYIVT